MFNMNSFYGIKVLKLHYLYFFLTKTPIKKSKNLSCVTRPKCDKMQIHIKNYKKLKSKSCPNYATVIIEFCLSISLE